MHMDEAPWRGRGGFKPSMSSRLGASSSALVGGVVREHGASRVRVALADGRRAQARRKSSALAGLAAASLGSSSSALAGGVVRKHGASRVRVALADGRRAQARRESNAREALAAASLGSSTSALAGASCASTVRVLKARSAFRPVSGQPLQLSDAAL